MAQMNGILNVDKAANLTSRQVVDEIIRLSGEVKAGHTGTLDPFATGVLVVCLGKATRLAEYIVRLPKTYIATLCLGATSDTLDKTGRIQEGAAANPPASEQVAQVLSSFVGEIEQVPPIYSAVRVNGMRLYELARKNTPVDPIRPRRVSIYSIKMLEYNFPYLKIEVSSSRGTYMRALARDVGERLETGAYLEELRRTRVGHFKIEDALSLSNSFAADGRRQTCDLITKNLLPMEMAVKELTKITVTGEEIKKISLGQPIALPSGLKGSLDEQTHDIAALNQDAKLVAIMTAQGGSGKSDKETGLLKPKKVFV
jgi:tRNA pseudouridine55 synthase